MVRFFILIEFLLGFTSQIQAQEDEEYSQLYDSLWYYWDRDEANHALRISDILIYNYPLVNYRKANIYNLRSILYFNFGDLINALESCHIALELEPDSVTKAAVNSNLAYMSINIGDFTGAIEVCSEALLNHPKNYPEYLAINYLNLGYIYSMFHEWELSLVNYHKCVNVCLLNRTPVNEFYYINCAYSYMHMGFLDSSMMYYNNVLKQKLSSESATVLYYDYANFMHELNKNKETIKYYHKASMESLKLPEGHIYRYYCLLEIGKFYVKTEQYREGLDYLNQAKQANAHATKDINRLELYHTFSLAYEGLAQEAGTCLLDTALHYLDTAITQVSAMCNSIISEESILKLSELQNGLYKTGTRIAHKLFAKTGEIHYAEKAFQYAEREKYAVLTQMHNRNEAGRAVSIPDSILFLQAQLKTGLANMRFELGNNKVSNPDSLKEQIFNTSGQLEALIKQVETQYPDYRKFKFLDKPVQVKTIQEYLHSRQVLIEYALHDSVGYAFIISSDTFTISKFTADSTFYDYLAMYQSVLHNNLSLPYEQYKESARYLYNALVLPYKELIGTKKELVLIPDIGLGSISFEALLTKDYQPVPMIIYKTEEPYLIRDYAISYAYSANSLIVSKNKKYPFWRKMISFTPDYTNSPDTLMSLESTLAYSKKIDRWFLGKSLTGKKATETRFKKDNHYEIINIYAHGTDEDKNSFIYMCPADSLNDSYLYTHEVGTMGIKANLVALVTCYSGRGESIPGEGLLSMGRSFTLSGSAAVISSLWAAASDPSMQIMKEFYKQLRLGKNKARAMQIAKLKFLEDTDTVQAHPKMWSGIVIFGNSSSLFNPIGGCAIALITIVLISILVRRKLGKRS